jgi:hypothetical protein
VNIHRVFRYLESRMQQVRRNQLSMILARGTDGSRIVEKGDRFRPMPNAHSYFSSDYSSWLDQWVILKVATGKSQTELVCTVIAESDEALRVRIAETCEVDIYKEMILGVAQAWPVQVLGYLDLEPPEDTCFSPPSPSRSYAT